MFERVTPQLFFSEQNPAEGLMARCGWAVRRRVLDEADRRLRDLLAIEREIGVHPKYRNRRSQFSARDAAFWEQAHQQRMFDLAAKANQAHIAKPLMERFVGG